MKVVSVSDVSKPVESFPDRAYGIAKSVDGKWKVVSIGYNVDTGATGDLKVERDEPDHGVAVEAFKIEVANSRIL